MLNHNNNYGQIVSPQSYFQVFLYHTNNLHSLFRKLELPQNVQNITWSHKIYRGNYENLEGRIDSRRKNVTETKIQRGIFQGGALSPLLFIIAMMPLNHIYSENAQPGVNLVDCRKRSINLHEWHQTICKKWKKQTNWKL